MPSVNTSDAVDLWLKWCRDLLAEIQPYLGGWSLAIGPGIILHKGKGLVVQDRGSSGLLWDPLVPVKIAAILVGLTAVLDYSANEVVRRYKLPVRGKNIYFPVGGKRESADEEEFKRKMDKEFPELATRAPAVYEVFRECQPFVGRLSKVSRLKQLVNENKHMRLTPVSVSGESLKLGPSGYQRADVQWPPGQPFQMGPTTFERARAERIVFEESGEAVADFLKECIHEVEWVVAELRRAGVI